jgi:transcriptional regulator with XRE-family HTH domain
MEGFYREFGELLRARRKSAGLTQSAVAERVGLKRTSITNMEKGRQHVQLHQLFRLASALGAQPEELLPSAGAGAQEPMSLEALDELRDASSEDRAMVARVLRSAATSTLAVVDTR